MSEELSHLASERIEVQQLRGEVAEMSTRTEELLQSNEQTVNYNNQLEGDNEKLGHELQLVMKTSSIKEQQIDSLNLQLKH